MAGKFAESIITELNERPGHDRIDVDSRQLESELKESLVHILTFYQEEDMEVPFIWTYRRDYVHPKLTRKHLWKVVSYDEEFEKLITMKKRLMVLYNAVNAAAASLSEDPAESKRLLRERKQNIRDLTAECKRLAEAARDAESDLQTAYTIIDAKNARDDEVTEEDSKNAVERRQECDKLQEELKETTEMLDEVGYEYMYAGNACVCIPIHECSNTINMLTVYTYDTDL